MDRNNNSDLFEGEDAPHGYPTAKAKIELENFFASRSSDIEIVSKSVYRTYTEPKNWFHKLINILNSAHKKKIKDCQVGCKVISECDILNHYKKLVMSDLPIPEIGTELTRALKNISQHKITSFFSKQNVSSSTSRTKCVSPNVSKAQEDRSNIRSWTAAADSSSLFGLFDIPTKEAEQILKSIRLDEDMIKSSKAVELIKSFQRSYTELETIKFYDRESKLTTDKKIVLDSLEEIKISFKTLGQLCNSEQNSAEASELSLEEMVEFLKRKSDEANKVAREIFIKLNSQPFLLMLRDVSHRIRKRISNIKNQTADAGLLQIDCCLAGKCWDECLVKLETDGWTPNPKNGYVSLSDFKETMMIFRSMELRGDQFVAAHNLLKWLKKSDHEEQVLQSLIQNLPMIKVKKYGYVVLLSVTSFLNDKHMIEDFFHLLQNDEKNRSDTEIMVKPGVVIETPRAAGSGRPRIVDTNHEILDTVKDFTESAGVAAHERRRTNVGRIGFTIEDVRKVLLEKIFHRNPENCPSAATIRRLFEAPNQARNTKTYYKADIAARPGTKRNDETAWGEGGHPHRHQCFSFFRKARYQIL